jgi:magnesium-protoporphyrin O-methyltransferase
VPSCQCCAIDDQFDRARAEQDLRQYHRKGPQSTTRHLVRVLRQRSPAGSTVLDIGGGVGVIHHELLNAGFERAVHVDRSQAYIDVAQREASAAGHADRVRFIHGDFRAVADALEPADVVTLDRVVCCDADYATLLPLAAQRARQVLAMTFPRDRWLVRAFVALSNAWRRMRGSAFRVYVHSPQAMATLLQRLGMHRALADTTFAWNIELWERAL